MESLEGSYLLAKLVGYSLYALDHMLSIISKVRFISLELNS